MSTNSEIVHSCVYIMIFQEFKLERRKINLEPLTLPEDMALMDALDRVLRLPSVASKRYLTNKV